MRYDNKRMADGNIFRSNRYTGDAFLHRHTSLAPQCQLFSNSERDMNTLVGITLIILGIIFVFSHKSRPIELVHNDISTPIICGEGGVGGGTKTPKSW